MKKGDKNRNKIRAKFVVSVIIVFGIVVIISMGLSIDRGVDSDIRAFVYGSNFPKLRCFHFAPKLNRLYFPEPRRINILLDIPEHNVKVFEIRYGELQDIPSGAFFSRATGIRHNDKIGWISVENYAVFDLKNLQRYDLDSDDEYLFTDEFLNELKSKDDWVYQYRLLPLLAKDPDTPRGTLLKIAERKCSSLFHPSLANALLENPNVLADKQILVAIADLPVSSGDAYKEARDLLCR